MWIPFTACTHLEASPPRGFGAPHYLYLQELINTKAPSWATENLNWVSENPDSPLAGLMQARGHSVPQKMRPHSSTNFSQPSPRATARFSLWDAPGSSVSPPNSSARVASAFVSGRKTIPPHLTPRSLIKGSGLTKCLKELGHDLLHRQKINSVLKYTHIKLKKQLRTSLKLKKTH